MALASYLPNAEAMLGCVKTFAEGFGITDLAPPPRLSPTRRVLAVAQLARETGRLAALRATAFDAYWRRGWGLESDEDLRWIAREAGPASALLAVENGWFVGPRKVMIEKVRIHVSKVAGAGRPIDLEFTWTPVDKPITLRGAEGKSYGGLNFRFAPRPEKETVITVPAGSPKEDLPETPLPWADLSARFAGGKGPSGAAIFVSPGHPDYPPTWLTRHYGVLCVGWPGVKGKTFEPGVPFRLDYRVWVHRGDVGPEQLKRVYDGYVAGLKAGGTQ